MEGVAEKKKKYEELLAKYNQLRPDPCLEGKSLDQMLQRINDNKKKIEQFIVMLKSLEASDSRINQKIHELQVATRQLNNAIEEAKTKKQEEGFFKRIWNWIISSLCSIIKFTYQLITTCLTLGMWNTFKIEREKQLEAQEQASKFLQVQTGIKSFIQKQMTARDYIIGQIRKYETETLPDIEKFYIDLMAMSPN